MDFFEHQDLAQRKSKQLIALFSIGVLLLVLLLNVVMHGALLLIEGYQPEVRFERSDYLLGYAITTLIALVIIGCTSAWKLHALNAGGRYIAERLGGKLVVRGLADGKRRRLLNVVDEMALASGVPAPQVFVLEGGGGINAFAAGTSSSDAAIAVTEELLDRLDRDELQGVIAHEFSHIVHGDMRLNVRLIGILAGILAIHLTGSMILHSLRGLRFAGSSRKGAGGAAMVVIAVVLVGCALWLIGWIGHLVGQIIKAAVSRQREFLADAAAVQYTRLPDGIGNALRKIGHKPEFSLVRNAKAQEVSHMFFCSGLRFAVSAIDTHPPLEQRIRRILPHWDGSYLASQPARDEAGDDNVDPAPDGDSFVRDVATAAVLIGDRGGRVDPDATMSGLGTPSTEQIAFGAAFVRKLPQRIRDAVSEPHGARAVLYALLIDPDDVVRTRQLRTLHKKADAGVVAEFERLSGSIAELGDGARLPLLELALPALRELSEQQHRQFLRVVHDFIAADERISLSEYALFVLLRHYLQHKRAVRQYYALHPLLDPATTVLSTLAHYGKQADAAAAAFQAGMRKLEAEGDLLPRERCRAKDFDAALQRLQAGSIKIRRQLLEACLCCAAFDRAVNLREAELLRCIGGLLDLPLPPLITAPGRRHDD